MPLEMKWFKTKEERGRFIRWAIDNGYRELSRGKVAMHRAPVGKQYWVSLVAVDELKSLQQNSAS